MPETKNNILYAAIQLWSHDPHASLDEIARHTGISRRTLHRHYNGREDLVSSVLTYLINEYLESVEARLSQKEESAIERLKKLFYNDIRKADKYLVFRNLIKHESPGFSKKSKDVQKLYTYYRALFDEIIQEGELMDSISARWIELFYSAVIEASIKAIREEAAAEDLMFISWRSFWHGIKKP